MTKQGRTDDLRAAFRFFAEWECAGRSPLYEALALAIAEDDALLALSDLAGRGQPRPNLLIAAVHFLLLRDRSDPALAAFYPSLTEEPHTPEKAFPAFKAFCAMHRTQLVELLATRRVGTNEVRRSACLLPAFLTIGQLAPPPLHLIEVGTSAGLNLLWNKLRYDYGPNLQVGPKDAPLTLTCELRRAPPGDWTRALPVLGTQLGIDLEPMDPTDEDDALWLRALVWPEQQERAARLSKALALAARLRPEVRRGDGFHLLPKIVEDLPSSGTLCIFHSFMLVQASASERAAFEALLDRLGRLRPVWRIAFEWGKAEAPTLTLFHYRAGRRAERLLGIGDAQGQWLDWQAGPLEASDFRL